PSMIDFIGPSSPCAPPSSPLPRTQPREPARRPADGAGAAPLDSPGAGHHTSPMSPSEAHRPVQAPGLPEPIGPYAPAVAWERLVFVSGQGATDPTTGALAGPDVRRQTEQVFRNLAA